MGHPTRIGRYEVLTLLATGGMAEVFLARLHGAEGFQQNVVIKRMLPHFARDPDFRAMFIDEARIVSRLSHPNVVHVRELIEEEDELYLVMEYLSGETLGALLRALSRREEKLPYQLMAHILSEAAAGLHAAHELKDANGNPCDVVHRDVSPQNIFIGYDGSVKLIDFGIAKATDGANVTEAGTVKGKFGYMSPEQLRSQPLDRRSDIFSCGVILYEMILGRRLFNGNGLAIAQQLLDPSSTPRLDLSDPSVPTEIALVADRALARDTKDRYQTATEFRGALLNCMRALPVEVSVPEDGLGRIMDTFFSDTHAKKKRLLSSASMPLEDLATDPTVNKLAAAPSSSRRFLPMVAVLLLSVGVAAGFALASDEDPVATPLPPAAAPLPRAAAPSPVPLATPMQGARVETRIETSPPGARVTVNGEDLGTTPTNFVSAAGESVVIQLRLARHESVDETFVATGDDPVFFRELTRVRRTTMHSSMMHVETMETTMETTTEMRGFYPLR